MCNEMLSSSKNGKSRGLQQPGTVPILLLNTSPHSQPLWPLSNEGSLGRDGLNWYYKLSTNGFCSAGLDKLWGWLATHFFHFFGSQRVKDIIATNCNIFKHFAFLAHSCSISGSIWISQALICSQGSCSARYLVAAYPQIFPPCMLVTFLPLHQF